ncbi:MAG: hypothetical protein H6830_08330 [Planctomycetes bacterium]|nr:hypothetical protein [Planctomycetota bacterium]MCB9911791.1 hypothetical protein [Planctomycetota bacterium]HPF13981.1 hypothetical protein [Planctomycetota bacterium]
MKLPWKKRPPVRMRPCPLCGEPVSVGALACRACGSDAQTGWSEDADEGLVDLGTSQDAFDYDAFLAKEFPTEQGLRSRLRHSSQRWIAIGMIVALVLVWVFLIR